MFNTPKSFHVHGNFIIIDLRVVCQTHHGYWQRNNNKNKLKKCTQKVSSLTAHRFPVLCGLVLSMQSVMAQLVTDTVCVKAPSGANKSSKS